MLAADGPNNISTDPKAGDRRLDPRHDATGEHVRRLVRKMQYVLHLKDLSCTGLCALTDAPLAPGDRAFLLFDDEEPLEAEVRWVRKARFGASFCEPLPLETLRRLRGRRNGRARRR